MCSGFLFKSAYSNKNKLMPTEHSIKVVEGLTKDFRDSSVVITAEYRGMTVADMEQFRGVLEKDNLRFRVAKNTLARIAADKAELPELKSFIDGPVGFLLGLDRDPAAVAKCLMGYTDENESEALKITGGVLENEPLRFKDIEMLSKLPSKNALAGHLVQTMVSPVYALVQSLSTVTSSLTTVIELYKTKQEAT